MMAHEEPRRIGERIATQNLPRLGVFDRRRIEWNAELLHGIECPPVGQPVLASQLNCIHVATC